MKRWEAYCPTWFCDLRCQHRHCKQFEGLVKTKYLQGLINCFFLLSKQIWRKFRPRAVLVEIHNISCALVYASLWLGKRMSWQRGDWVVEKIIGFPYLGEHARSLFKHVPNNVDSCRLVANIGKRHDICTSKLLPL